MQCTSVPNRCGQLAYLTLLGGITSLFLFQIGPYLPFDFFPYATVTQVFAWSYAALATFVVLSLRDPGTITERNWPAVMRRWPAYDGLLYERGRVCRTCGLRKPPRSSHSSVTGRCIAMHDHYCIWVNNDIGSRTHGWFVLFLLLHMLMLLHGTVACGSLLVHAGVRQPSARSGGGNAEWSWRRGGGIGQHAWTSMRDIVYLTLLLWVLAVVAGGFLGFHLYLAAHNMTMKEFYKWRAVQTVVRTSRREMCEAQVPATSGTSAPPASRDIEEIEERVEPTEMVGAESTAPGASGRRLNGNSSETGVHDEPSPWLEMAMRGQPQYPYDCGSVLSNMRAFFGGAPR